MGQHIFPFSLLFVRLLTVLESDMSLVLLEILLEAEKQTTVSYNRVQSLLPALLVGN